MQSARQVPLCTVAVVLCLKTRPQLKRSQIWRASSFFFWASKRLRVTLTVVFLYRALGTPKQPSDRLRVESSTRSERQKNKKLNYLIESSTLTVSIILMNVFTFFSLQHAALSQNIFQHRILALILSECWFCSQCVFLVHQTLDFYLDPNSKVNIYTMGHCFVAKRCSSTLQHSHIPWVTSCGNVIL